MNAATPAANSIKKIVGLVPARNEGARIEFCLRALAQFTDAIIYLDDCSTDDTAQRVESLAQECRVERILRKTEWFRDEPGDRNRLLQAGREIGGTHFVVLDADEAFTANLFAQQALRRAILALQPGEQLEVLWIQLWRGFDYFRDDQSVWTHNYKIPIFCDDGRCSYESSFIHTARSPANLAGARHRLDVTGAGLLHFQFVNWRNLLLKQAWYRCLEHIRDPQKPAETINELYAPSKDETELGLKPTPAGWLEYSFLDRAALTTPDNWRERQVEAWFAEYGLDNFKDLNIWDIDWALASRAPPIKKTGPRISVIVSTYNGERFLSGCLDDLEAQTIADDLEIIVIDSGSPQNEKAIVAERQKRRGNMVYVRTERETIYAAWNRAIGLARGAYLTNANVDDRHAPDAFEKLADALDRQPRMDVVYANSALTNEPNSQFGHAPLRGVFRWPSFDRRLLFSVCFIGPQPMWRKTLHERFGLFDMNYTSAGDYEFWLRISAGAGFLHLPETLGLYLDHEASVEHAAPSVSQREANEARKKHWPPEWGPITPRAGTFFQPIRTGETTGGYARTAAAGPAPTVSVIIPTGGRRDTLREAVQSVLDQTFKDVEVIVVNDAGPDVSQMLAPLRNAARIISLRQEQSRERSAARNLGLSAARGKYVAYLDDDDIFYPDHLASLVAILRLTGQKIAYSDACCAQQFPTGMRREPFLSVDFSPRRLLISNFIPIQCVLHEKICLNATGGFDEQMNSGEDWELWIRLSRHFSFVHLKKITSEFRTRPDTDAQNRLLQQRFMRSAELIHERFRFLAPDDPKLIRQQRDYIDGIQQKCKPTPRDGVAWMKYRFKRPFQNLRHSLRKRLAPEV